MVAARWIAIVQPCLECIPRVMEREKILKVVVGKEKVRNAGRFVFVIVRAALIVAMVEIKVRPNLDGGGFVFLALGLVILNQRFVFSAFGDGAFGRDENERRLEATCFQRQIIQKALQTPEVSPLGLTFTNDDVATGWHDTIRERDEGWRNKNLRGIAFGS